MNNSSYVKNCFFIKNKKKFFSYEKVITVREAIELCKDKKVSSDIKLINDYNNKHY